MRGLRIFNGSTVRLCIISAGADVADCGGEANSEWGAETHGTNGDLIPNRTREDLSFPFKSHDRPARLSTFTDEKAECSYNIFNMYQASIVAYIQIRHFLPIMCRTDILPLLITHFLPT